MCTYKWGDGVVVVGRERRQAWRRQRHIDSNTGKINKMNNKIKQIVENEDHDEDDDSVMDGHGPKMGGEGGGLTNHSNEIKRNGMLPLTSFPKTHVSSELKAKAAAAPTRQK